MAFIATNTAIARLLAVARLASAPAKARPTSITCSLPTVQEQFFLAIGNAYRSAISNPGSFGQLVSNGLTNAGYCGMLPIMCSTMIQLSVDAWFIQSHIDSWAFAYWYTDPRSMINGHSVMYWSAMAIFQSQLPAMPFVVPFVGVIWPQ